jgi:uncharacterized protein (TIGR02596 family)
MFTSQEIKSNPMRSLSPTRARVNASGFTLIEMLVVVGIIALIVAAMLPLVFSSVAASRLTTAGQSVAAHISFARQRAISANQEVEVRFYSYDDPDRAGTDSLCTTIGLFAITNRSNSNNAATNASLFSEQVGQLLHLPTGIAFGNSNALSPIFNDPDLTPQADTAGIISKAQANYKSYSIFPDGSTTLTNGPAQTYVTLVEDRFAAGNGTDVPRNFFTIQIDRATGRTTTYRP